MVLINFVCFNKISVPYSIIYWWIILLFDWKMKLPRFITNSVLDTLIFQPTTEGIYISLYLMKCVLGAYMVPLVHTKNTKFHQYSPTCKKYSYSLLFTACKFIKTSLSCLPELGTWVYLTHFPWSANTMLAHHSKTIFGHLHIVLYAPSMVLFVNRTPNSYSFFWMLESWTMTEEISFIKRKDA